jgi:hypothetical protein
MSSAPVFNLNDVIPTLYSPVSLDSQVSTLVTSATQVAKIDSATFLAFTGGGNLQDETNVLLPGAEQTLLRTGNRSVNVDGNLSIYLKGDASQNAFSLAVGTDRESLAQGVNLATQANQTGVKEEYWAPQITTNVDQVKVSYFLPTSAAQNSDNIRFTFDNEDLIQWGNRTLQRWSTETRVVVGAASGVTEGNEHETIHGNIVESNYAGYNVESVNGGIDVHMVVGLKALYQEGLTWTINGGSALLLHTYYGVLQVIGTAASLLKGAIVQSKVRSVTLQVKAAAMRIGSGRLNVLIGALSGNPRI